MLSWIPNLEYIIWEVFGADVFFVFRIKLPSFFILTDIRNRKCEHEKCKAREGKSNPETFFTYRRDENKIKTNTSPVTDRNGDLTQGNKNIDVILYEASVPAFSVQNLALTPQPVAVGMGLSL